MMRELYVDETIERFEAMCESVGSDATPAQVERLVTWAVEHFGTDLYRTAGNIALHAGVTAVYTEFSMRCGEMGQ